MIKIKQTTMKKKLFIISVLAIICLSTNAQWQQTSLNYGTIRGLVKNGNILYAGSDGKGMFLSTNYGNTWNASTSPSSIISLAQSGNNVFAGTFGSGLIISSDTGKVWNTSSLSSSTIHSIAANGNNIFAGTVDGIYFSSNNGTSWTLRDNGISGDLALSFLIKGNNTFAGTWGTGVFLSTNNGVSWTAVNNGLSYYGGVKSFCATGNYIFTGTNVDGIYRSSDNGSSWNIINKGLDSTNSVTALAVYGSSIFAGTSGGVYISKNNGDNWTEINTGLASTNVLSLLVVGDTLFAGTHAGVSKLLLSDNFIIDAGSDKSIICGGSVELNSITSIYTGTGTLSYLWSPSAGLDYDTVPNPTATVTNNTKYFVTVTDNNGWTASDSMNVLIAPFTANAASDTLICGGNAQLNVTSNYSGAGVLTYKWLPSVGLSDSTIINPIATVTNDTKYYVTVTTPNGCNAVDSVIVHVNPLIADAEIDKTIICGGSVQLDSITTNYTGSGVLTYKWSPSVGLSDSTIINPIATVTNDTKYYVTVTTPNGCNAIDSVTVNVNPLTANAGSDKTIMCGGSVQLDNVTTNYSGTGVLTYKWSPSAGLSDSTIINPISNATSDTKYYVTVTTPNGCNASSSVNLTLIPLNATEICLVGVDSLNKNTIIWDKTIASNIDSFYIYKETGVTNVYAKIGSVSYNSLSVFVDTASHPDVQSNKYKMSIIDDCNLESLLSDFHKTMHLTINQGTSSNIWNLIWEEYDGFTVSSYNIYRGTSPDTLTKIGSVLGGNTTFTDNAPSGYVYYQIEVVSPNNCNPSKSFNSSRSNIATNKHVGIIETNNLNNLVSIYPNPGKEKITIDFAGNTGNRADLDILSIDGKLLQHISLTQKKTDIDISSLPIGIYEIKITGNSEVAIKKLVKE